jgi:hypothetical protein
MAEQFCLTTDGEGGHSSSSGPALDDFIHVHTILCVVARQTEGHRRIREIDPTDMMARNLDLSQAAIMVRAYHTILALQLHNT